MDRRRFINTVVQSSVIAGGFVTIPQLNIGDKIDGPDEPITRLSGYIHANPGEVE